MKENYTHTLTHNTHTHTHSGTNKQTRPCCADGRDRLTDWKRHRGARATERGREREHRWCDGGQLTGPGPSTRIPNGPQHCSDLNTGHTTIWWSISLSHPSVTEDSRSLFSVFLREPEKITVQQWKVGSDVIFIRKLYLSVTWLNEQLINNHWQ